MYQNIMKTIKSDLLFSISLCLAVISIVFGRFDSSFIDVKVLYSLFGLMVVVESFKQLGILEAIANLVLRIANTKRQLFLYFISLSFVSSMFLTNDVAILTLLPMFYLICTKRLKTKELVFGSVWIIVAANLGSSLFPSGNPQNIFLFSYYELSLKMFFSWMLPFALVAIMLLSLGLIWIPKERITENDAAVKMTRQGIGVAIFSFFLMLLYVVNLVGQWWIVVVVLVLMLWRFPKSYAKIDYRLLLTFVCFFIIVGNIKESPQVAHWVSETVRTSKSALVSSALISQVISNVPAAFLLAPFTKQAHSLVIGTNIGGMGTLIASLANLIGYRVLTTYVPQIKGAFLLWFSLFNVCYFSVFIVIFWFLS
ncbi:MULTISPECIES: SLC13 family permease [Enterococcus]|uniref:Citrate transporter-like domain-containing protein n=1 Tax=Enterococcus sulfureus ATCC 49903 TaxID=1140003 RepID=S0KLW9_9ENTE|nr:SLC13 family permease [Enterococcus sulfureus]EOT45804.1 hypothetical protein OMY_02037 [Enterococcus sulfureus ATCC 49903]EOT82931.1 hypothetical protein I573_02044 [Enterococcus sulfureus ATCC 49903]